MIQLFWKAVWKFLLKTKTYLIYNTTIALGIYPRLLKTHVHTNLYVTVYIRYFLIGKETATKLPTVSEWLSTFWYIHATECSLRTVSPGR